MRGHDPLETPLIEYRPSVPFVRLPRMTALTLMPEPRRENLRSLRVEKCKPFPVQTIVRALGRRSESQPEREAAGG